LDYFLGRWQKSLSDLLAMRDQFKESGAVVPLIGTEVMLGYLYCDRGEYDLARRAYEAANELQQSREPARQAALTARHGVQLGLVDLMQGRIDSVRARLKETESLLPQLDSVGTEGVLLPFRLLEAEVLLVENRLKEAIEAGQRIVRENVPSLSVANISTYNRPFLKDVLARAYWKSGDLDKAVAEYVRLTTIDPNNQVRYLIHPLYHYRLGRVYEDKGDKAQAAAEYRKFLEYWKDADATHPELADARKRLASLR
jgi:tetratricopeptide (TPR) repeat protein